MSWYPTFNLYEDDGSTLVYAIADVIRIDGWNYADAPANYIELTNTRSTGSIIIPAGDQPYDITLYARLGAANYTALMSAFNTLKSSIAKKTPYVLKLDVSNSSTNNINVMRLQPIIIDTTRGNLNKFLYYNLTLRGNTWS